MPASTGEILRADRVTKRFGAQVAVNAVSYALREFEVAGILGSNGAGKTTFFNVLTGYFAPEEGSIYLHGKDITATSRQQRVAAGVMRTFQLTSTFDNLTVIDNLVLAYFRAYRKPGLLHMLTHRSRAYYREERILQNAEAFNLTHLLPRMVRNLSLGEKRRLEIAMSVLVSPKVLLLDEPLAGLAESEIQGVLDVLRGQIGKQTILIVEHKISHIKDLVERVTVMHEGRIIADGGYDECMNHPEVRRSYWQIADEAPQQEAAS